MQYINILKAACNNSVELQLFTIFKSFYMLKSKFKDNSKVRMVIGDMLHGRCTDYLKLKTE